MKSSFLYTYFIFLFIIGVCSCRKDKVTPPIVTTRSVKEITWTTATSGGDITNNGGATVIERGVCWNISSNPTINNSRTIEGGSSGSYASNLTTLSPNTKYYVRAYATNSAGTGYGNEVTFSTSQIILPTVTTNAATNITSTTAGSGGSISSDGGSSITARGLCWGISANPDISGLHTTDGSGIGSFTSSLEGLTPGTTYHVRAYATNVAGIAYGNDIMLTTPAVQPNLTTVTAMDITQTSAISGGNIISDGGSKITARGVCWSQNPDPNLLDSHTTDGLGQGFFTSLLTNLQSATTYYIRAYATNSVGTSYGNQIGFTTRLNIPSGTKTKFLTLISVNNSWSTYEDNTWEKNFKFKENEFMQIFEVCIWNTENPKVSLYMFDKNFEPTRVEFLSGGQDWVNYRESYNLLDIETPSRTSQEYLDAFKTIIKTVFETQPAEHYGIKSWGHNSGSSSLFEYKIYDDDAEKLLEYINSLISKKIDFLDWSRNCTEGRYNRVVREYKYADYILASDQMRMGYAMAGGAEESSQMIETFFSPAKSIRQSLIDMINQDRLSWEADFTKNDMITRKIKQSISIYDTDKFEDMLNSTNLNSTDYTGDVLEYIKMNYPSEVQKFLDFRFHYVNNKDFFTWDKDSNGFLKD